MTDGVERRISALERVFGGGDETCPECGRRLTGEVSVRLAGDSDEDYCPACCVDVTLKLGDKKIDDQAPQ
ncbi:MAG: hypothetical protein IRY88_15185 [Rubrobacteraceae bacterium]|nr:hypothetical protein [Rubrobacteraceae bacterium]